MKLPAIKTVPVRAQQSTLVELIDKYVVDMPPRSVLAISSKVVALCEGRVVKVGEVDKNELVRGEAQYYLAPERNPYGVSLTVNRDMLIAWSGIDESNGDGHFVLWPENPQHSANLVRAYLSERFGPDRGVLITDSVVVPMRRGTVGLGLSHSGFLALEDYVGTGDVFGNYDLKYTYASIIDGLAAAAVVVMGEGSQSTPLVLLEELDFVKFQDRSPSDTELETLRIPLEEDLYGEMLKQIPWDKRPEQT